MDFQSDLFVTFCNVLLYIFMTNIDFFAYIQHYEHTKYIEIYFDKREKGTEILPTPH